MSFIKPLFSVRPPGTFVVIGPPTVLSISPSSGDFGGGTAVTITGTNFISGATVTIGGHACTSVIAVSSTTITATTGVAVVADVGVAKDVVVTTAKGTGTGAGLFTYTAWFQAFQIGGVNPTWFADFTTQGTTNHYFFNGATQASSAAWLTALGATFSRASSAFRTNSSGLLESVSSNVLRFDFDPIALTSRGILMEGAATNLLQDSQDYTVGWTLGSTTITAAATTAPDGTATGQKVTSIAAGVFASFAEQTGLSITGGATCTATRYFKFFDTQWVMLAPFLGGDEAFAWFDIENGVLGTTSTTGTATVVSSSITNVGNGWFRCALTFSLAVGDTSVTFYEANAASNGSTSTVTGSYFGWGGQFEQQSFASSYIVTTNATVTRSADALTATPISWYNATNSVIFGVGSASVPGNTTPCLIDIRDAGANNEIFLAAASGGDAGGVLSGGVFTFHGLTPTPWTANTTIKEAMSAAANSFAFVENAGVATTSGAGAMPVSPTNLSIGEFANGGGPINGHITQIGYWGTTATVAQLQSLTT